MDIVYTLPMYPNLRKTVFIGLIFAFLANTFGPLPTAQAKEDPLVFAQQSGDLNLPAPGVMVNLSPQFTPAHLTGLIIHPKNALQFDFLINRGDAPLNDQQKKEEYSKLVKYFLASLTIPDEDQWVNLSPYEKNRIIKDDFGKTEMGRDLLAQDYILKQITSSLIYPEENLGRKFWDRVYERAYKEYGTTKVPVNTFNKVWIIPDEAAVYESGNTVYVLRNHLKVMLEEDYLSLGKHQGKKGTATHSIASKIIKEIVLPELEREVNEGKNFALLRQIYSGMILATWYKRTLKESLLTQVYADKAKVKGVNQDDPKNNEAIYQQYLKAFKKGVFNYIKEDIDKYTGQPIPRKYFSGGIVKGYTFSKGFVGAVIEEFGPKTGRAVPESMRWDAAMAEAKTDMAQVVLDKNVATADKATIAKTKQVAAGIKQNIYSEATQRQLFYWEAEYGFLPQDNPVMNLIRQRMAKLLPNALPEDVPRVEVLASRGQGVNACVFPDGTIMITPELLDIMDDVEELDFVLLHEINHWYRNHSQQIEENLRSRRLWQSVGLNRYHEYDADIAAFFEMVDQDVSGYGAIRLLEKLKILEEKRVNVERKARTNSEGDESRDELEKEMPWLMKWDFVHGATSDRIANLSGTAALIELYALTESLTPLGPEFKQALSFKEKPKNLNQYFTPHIEDVDDDKKSYIYGLQRVTKYFDDRFQRLEPKLNQLDVPQFIFILQGCFRRLELNLSDLAIERSATTEPGQSKHLENLYQIEFNYYRKLFLNVSQRIRKNQKFQRGFKSFIPDVGMQNAILGGIFVGMPVFEERISKDGTTVLNATGMMERERLVPNASAANHFLDFLVQGLPAWSAQLKAPLERDKLYGLLLYCNSIGQDFLGASMDWKGFLEFSAKVLKAYERNFPNDPETLKRLKTQIFFNGARVLAKGDQWDNVKERYFARMMPLLRGPDKGPDIDLYGLDLQISTLPGPLQNRLRPWCQAHWSNFPDQRVTINRLEAIREKISDLSAPKAVPLLKESIKLFNQLPENWLNGIQTPWYGFPIFTRRQLKEEWFDKFKIASSKGIERAIAWKAAMAEDDFHYDELEKRGVKAKRSDKVGPYQIVKNISFKQLNRIAVLDSDPMQAAAILGRSTQVKSGKAIVNDDHFQRLALLKLGERLSGENDADTFFRVLEDYVRLWPVSVVGKDLESRKVRRMIVRKGLEFLDLKQPLSARTRERVLSLSFFLIDPMIRRQVQEYFILEHIKNSSIEEGIDFLFHRYSHQQGFGSLKAIDYLIENTEDPDMLDRLQAESERLLAAVRQSEKSGQLVLMEGIGEMADIEKGDRSYFLRAILRSFTDDKNLRAYLSGYWWAANHTAITDILQLDTSGIRYDDEWKTWGKTPAPFERNASSKEIGEKVIPFNQWVVPFDILMQRFYLMTDAERYVLLRKLLIGPRGALNDAHGRLALLNDFLDQLLKTNGGDEDVSEIIRQMASAFAESASEDDAYQWLNALLMPRIAQPPKTPAQGWEAKTDFDQWVQESRKKMEYSLKGKKTAEGREMRAIVTEAIRSKLQSYIDGPDQNSPEQELRMEERLLSLVPGDFRQKRSEKMEPTEFIIEAARQFGTPGVRFLQLLGYVLDIPENYQEKFLDVYDNLRGQSKLAAWKTIKKTLPEYAKQIRKLGKRIGGGSMYTVYEVYLKKEGQAAALGDEEPDEVVRVMNPNAEFLASRKLKIQRQVLEKLAAADKRYEQVLPLLDLLDEWIKAELNDPHYEQEDADFYQKWDGWKPSEGWSRKVVIPKTIETGTNLVRREQYVKGRNLRDLKKMAPAEQKEMIALEAQHFVSQFMDGTTVSDVSFGNEAETPEGDLVIFDRGLKLKFDDNDKAWVFSLMRRSGIQQKVEIFVDGLENFNDSNRVKIDQIGKAETVRRIMHMLPAADNVENLSKLAVDMNRCIYALGLRLPLKYMLLFKNLGVLERFVEDARKTPENKNFSLQEALTYQPDKAMTGRQVNALDNKGGIDLNSAKLNLHIERHGPMELPISRQDFASLSHIEGFVPVILKIQSAAGLPIFAEISTAL